MPLAPIGSNSRNENTIHPGSLVEYEQHGRPVLAKAVSEQRGKWLVANDEGAEVEIPAIRLYLYPAPPPALQNTPLADLNGQAAKGSQTIDLHKVWEHINVRSREYSVSELAQVVFGNDMFFSHLVTRRALLLDKVYFKRGKNGFEPRPEEQVLELRQKAELEQQRAVRREALLDSLVRKGKGEAVEFPAEIEWLEQIAAVGRAGEFHHEAVGIFNQAVAALGGETTGGPLDERIFRFLVKIGHFSPDQNLSFLRQRRPVKFDAEIEHEADAFVRAADRPFEPNRIDLREVRAIAIDNQSTKDVDDALSLEISGNGYRLGIHISDVAALIRPESEIFKESLYRATTVYCVDSTAPMMPAQLSEGSLSLLAGADRRALSFLIDLDSEFRVVGRTVVRSILRVSSRYSYDQVDRLLFDGQSAGDPIDPESAALIQRLWEAAGRNEAQRLGRGATQMPRRELFPEIGPDGSIKFVESGEDTPAHRMVGELMILANETAALYARDNRIPLAFRGQEPPDRPIEEMVAQTPDGPAREYHRRGALKRSTVGTIPLPHFGLGVDAYAQVSSPIRRAGDLINQEQITSFLDGGKPRFTAAELTEFFERLEGGLDEAQIIQRQRRRYFLIRHLTADGRTELQGTIVRTDAPRPLVELDGVCAIFVFNPSHGVVQSGESITVLDRARLGERIKLRIVKSDPRRELLLLDEVR